MEFKSNLSLTSNDICKNRFGDNLEDGRYAGCEPLSEEEIKKLNKELYLIRSNYTLFKDEPEKYADKETTIYFKLDKLNNLLNRVNIKEIRGLKKVIPVILELSISEYNKLRTCSLSILASSTYLFQDIIKELDENRFYDSINMNLQLPFFPEKRHVFRWIYNFLITHEDLSQQFFGRVSISDILEASIDYLSNIKDTFCHIMFLHIILLKNLTFEQVQACVLFFNYCFENPQEKGIHYVLFALHKLLSNTNSYPKEYLCTVVNSLKIENIISQYILNGNIDYEKCFSFCLLADLYELGFQDNSNLVPYLLQIININDLADWFLKHAIKSIYKILSFCDQEMVSLIFQNVPERLIEISTIEAYYCIAMLLNRVNMNELLSFISDNFIDLICSIVLTDDEILLNLVVTGFIRLVQSAEIYNETYELSQMFSNYDGFSIIYEHCSNNASLSSELREQLNAALEKL